MGLKALRLISHPCPTTLYALPALSMQYGAYTAVFRYTSSVTLTNDDPLKIAGASTYHLHPSSTTLPIFSQLSMQYGAHTAVFRHTCAETLATVIPLQIAGGVPSSPFSHYTFYILPTVNAIRRTYRCFLPHKRSNTH